MKVRYSISEKWESRIVHRVMDAIEFAIKKYEIEDPKSTLTVKLITGKGHSQSGTAARIKNKRYEIRVNWTLAPSERSALRTVFHEMTHVKQFVLNQFRPMEGGYHAKWEGKYHEYENYYMSPWEMEARAMEDPLFHEFEEIY